MSGSIHVGLDARFAARGLGIGRFVTDLARALVEIEDVSVTWLGAADVAPEGVRPHDLDRWPHPMLDLAPGRKLVGSLDVDVMHFTGNTGWMRPGPVPVVLTIHDVMFLRRDGKLTQRQRLGRTYIGANVRRAAAVATELASATEQAAAETAEALDLRRRLEVISHGAVPRAAMTPRRGRLTAFAGSDPRKGTWDLLELVRRAPRGLEQLVVLAGAGLPEGFREAAAPELASGRLRIEGWLERDEVIEIVASSVALVHPTRDEGFGLPVLEAMGWGVPVVTGLAPTTREVGGDAIMLIDPSDVVGSMVARVESLLQDEALRGRVVATSQARARRYGWDAAAASYVELYRRAISSPRTSQA